MIIQKPGPNVWIKILTGLLTILSVIFFVGLPQQILAEGNEPTATILPTTTIAVQLSPTDTPIPTEPAQEEVAPENDVISKDLDSSQMDDDAAPAILADTEVGSQPLLSSLGTTNLCLIGLIVIATIAVVIIIVYGVVKRIGIQIK